MSKGKEFQFGEESRKKILAGVNILNKCVSTTLGPGGRLVLHQKIRGNPVATKDGVSVAKQVSIKDEFENMGAQICRESAEKTNNEAGDGTTSSILLGTRFVNEGYRLVSAGHKPMDLKRGIDWAVEKVVAKLKEESKEVSSLKEIAQVGTISANGDTKIGELLAEAIDKTGNNGVITIEEGGVNTEFVSVVGYRFDKGFSSHHFINNDKGECVLENPLILITDAVLSNSAVVLPIMEGVYGQFPGRPILILAENCDHEGLAVIALNSIKGSLPACCVRNSGYGDRKTEVMNDIATLVGATVCSETLGYKIEKFDTAWLGQAKKAIITKNSTTIIEGAGDPENIQQRAKQIEASIESLDNDWDKDKQEERLAKFVGGIGVVKIGASSDAEMKEKKDRCEDALSATKSAVEEGISVGGGVSLLRISKELDNITPPEDIKYGVEIVKRALSAPIKQILTNAGLEPTEIILNILSNENKNFGYNAATDKYEDLMESGVIDPTKVIRCSIQNAASVAGILLLTEALIVDEEDEPKVVK